MISARGQENHEKWLVGEEGFPTDERGQQRQRLREIPGVGEEERDRQEGVGERVGHREGRKVMSKAVFDCSAPWLLDASGNAYLGH